jgi:hypothetical protein
MKCPTELYAPSTRPYDGLPDLAYPLHDRDIESDRRHLRESNGRRTSTNLLRRDQARKTAAKAAELPGAEPKSDANALIHRR